jgi:aminopeptidase N
VASYERGAGNESDLPLIIPSYSYKTRATRLGFYDRPANAYYELKELLGEELFKQGMLEYINRWNGKHPLPTDFFFTFNQVAGEDLSWFWNPWFYDFGYPDLAILNVENSEGTATATIKKVGNIPTRVNITFEFEDGTKTAVTKPSSIWNDGNDTIKLSIDTKMKVKHAVLGNDNIPDVTDNNNYFEIID